jgi:Tfp pilus assembly PilM family ATPase
MLKNGFISERKAVAEIIAATFQTRGIARSKIIAAIPGINSVSRILLITKGAGSLAQQVEQEARKVIPAVSESTNLYWQALESKGQAQQRIFVLAAPREPILALADTLKIAGFVPAAFELKPLALYRAIQRKDAIIANLEYSTLDVVIVVDDLPVLLRTSFTGDGPSATESLLGRLTDELSRTVRYYNDTNRQSPLGPSVPIFLSGDDVEDPGLVANIEALTGHPVEEARPPFVYPDDFPVNRFLVNIGLALKRI